MTRFNFTTLRPDEEIIFGPLTIALDPVTRTAVEKTEDAGTYLRVVGVTNQRLIVENGGRAEDARAIDQTQVREVIISPENFAGQPRLILDQVKLADGEIVPVQLALMDPEAEPKLRMAFSEARFSIKRGCWSFFPFLT